MTFILRLALYVLRGYREWTESLGSDREWRIQARQSEVFAVLSVEAAGAGALAVPFRHDMHIVVASNTPRHRLEYIAARVSGAAPVPVELRVGCGASPAEALDNAFFSRDGCGAREAALLAHVDINDITGYAREKGVYNAYLAVSRLYSRLVEELSEYGALVSYLGGDNLLVLLPFEEEPLIILEDVVEEMGAKAGVGYGVTGRAAAREATRCLDEIRRGRRSGLVAVCVEGEAPGWLRNAALL